MRLLSPLPRSVSGLEEAEGEGDCGMWREGEISVHPTLADGPNRDTDIYLYAKRIAHRETQLSLTCLFLFDSWPLTATTPKQDELRTTD